MEPTPPLTYPGTFDGFIAELHALKNRGVLAQIPIGDVPECLQAALRAHLVGKGVSQDEQGQLLVNGGDFQSFWHGINHGRELPAIQFQTP